MFRSILVTLVIGITISLTTTSDPRWHAEKQKSYTLYFTSADKSSTKEYLTIIDNGLTAVNSFFKTPFKHDFAIYVHPDRHSLDSTWRSDWQMPDFKSECWMVASGVGAKLDMISPKAWDQQACEHKYAETKQTQELITHELVHVFHGQQNVSPDFSTTEGIDWFVEGLATYASGQCDAKRLAEVKKAILANEAPDNLDKFWTGRLKYGLSGSMVMYVDGKYGRAKLLELLPLNKKSEVLSKLGVTEGELVNGWREEIRKL